MSNQKFFQRLMPPCILLLGFVVFCFGLTSVLHVSITRNVEKDWVFFEEPEYYVSTASQYDTVSHVFLLRNAGAPVKITRIRSTCACTKVPDLNGVKVDCGGSLKVPIHIDTRDVDTEAAGAILVEYRTTGDDAVRSGAAVARIRAKILPDYIVRPTLIDFGEVNGTQRESRKLTLRHVVNEDVVIEEINSTNEWFSASVGNQTPGEDISIEVCCAPQSWNRGPLRGRIWFRTSSDRRPVFQVNLRATYRPIVEVRPNALVVQARGDTESSHEIEVSGHSSFRITGIRSPHPCVGCCVKTSTTTEKTLQVTLDATTQNIDTAIEIDFVLSADSQSRICQTAVIPIHFIKAGA